MNQNPNNPIDSLRREFIKMLRDMQRDLNGACGCQDGKDCKCLSEPLIPAQFAEQLRSVMRRNPVMLVNKQKKDDAVLYHFDMPGLKIEDISVEFDRGVLKVHGERRVEATRTDDDGNLKVGHAVLGAFSHQVLLGDDVDGDRIEAEYKNGVLTIKAPVEKVEPRKIEVKGSLSPQE